MRRFKTKLLMVCTAFVLTLCIVSAGAADTANEESYQYLYFFNATTVEGEPFELVIGSNEVKSQSQLDQEAEEYISEVAKAQGVEIDHSIPYEVGQISEAERIQEFNSDLRVPKTESMIMIQALDELKAQIEELERENAVLTYENGNLKRQIAELAG